MNKEFILKVASHIENLPEPSDFNMNTEYHDCGAPACFLGWFNYLGSNGSKRGYQLLSQQHAMIKTGLTQVELVSLCYPDGEPGAYTINNVEGAKVLRHLVETGEVDFSVALQ